MSFLPHTMSQRPAFENKMHYQAQATQYQNHSQPRLTYYVVRTNNTIVPLVPADELPFNIRLAGVPRVLNSDHVLGMQQVGLLPYTGFTFKLEDDMSAQHSVSQPPPTSTHVRNHSGSPSKVFSAPDVLARQALQNSLTMDNGTEQQQLPQRPVSAHEISSNWRKAPSSDPQAVIDAIVGTTNGAETAARIGYQAKYATALPPSGNLVDQDRKEYCTHWIRHGECDYTQVSLALHDRFLEYDIELLGSVICSKITC